MKKHILLAFTLVLLTVCGCLVAQPPTETQKLLQAPENATYNPLTGEMTLKLKVSFSGNYTPDLVNEALEQVRKDIDAEYLLDQPSNLKLIVNTEEKTNSLTFTFP